MPAATNKILPFMKGQHGRLVVTQNRVRRSFDFKTWSLKPNVTKHNDGVNGEKRDRLDRTLNFYEMSAQAYMKDAEALKAFLEMQEPHDAYTTPYEETGGLRFYPRNGTKQSFILVELIWDDFDLSQGGRSENMMVSFSMRCTDVKEAKTVG
jgi:hypothetical protein